MTAFASAVLCAQFRRLSHWLCSENTPGDIKCKRCRPIAPVKSASVLEATLFARGTSRIFFAFATLHVWWAVLATNWTMVCLVYIDAKFLAAVDYRSFGKDSLNTRRHLASSAGVVCVVNTCEGLSHAVWGRLHWTRLDAFSKDCRA